MSSTETSMDTHTHTYLRYLLLLPDLVVGGPSLPLGGPGGFPLLDKANCLTLKEITSSQSLGVVTNGIPKIQWTLMSGPVNALIRGVISNTRKFLWFAD